MFLVVPNLADYVKKMVITPWKVCWNEKDILYGWIQPVPFDTHRPYSDSVMRAFEEAINNSNSIPIGEKEHWISTIKSGNQNPVVALLLPRLYYLTYLELILGDRDDLFVLKTLKGIVEDSSSSSLSQLREVKVLGRASLTHRLELATACVALPSIVSVRARWLVEGPLDSAETTYQMVPRSSCVRDIEINDCCLSRDTWLNLIRAVKSKSLRSFKYSYSAGGDHPAYDWIYAALFRFSSKSLEELSLRRHYSLPLNSMEFDFKRFRKLRVLAIDYALLMGNKFEITKKAVSFLPKSLEILEIYPCRLHVLQWLPDLVDSLARAKRNRLPRLKELNYQPTLDFFPVGGFNRNPRFVELRAIAAEAGFELTFTLDGPISWD